MGSYEERADINVFYSLAMHPLKGVLESTDRNALLKEINKRWSRSHSIPEVTLSCHHRENVSDRWQHEVIGTYKKQDGYFNV